MKAVKPKAGQMPRFLPIRMQYRENTYASGAWDTFWYETNLSVLVSKKVNSIIQMDLLHYLGMISILE